MFIRNHFAVVSALLLSTIASAQSDLSTSDAASNTDLSPASPFAGEGSTGSPALLDTRALMITNLGAATDGSDVSALQGNSTALGSNVNQAISRLAEDFQVSGTGWNIDALTVYAYQTQIEPSTISTITGMTLRIWDGDPALPESTVLFGDTTTNLLSQTSFASIYRTTFDLTNAQRAVQGATASPIGITLPPGTYWADYGLIGSPSLGGPFAPYITLVGVPASGVAKWLNVSTGTWTAIVDAGSGLTQTMPLRIDGTVFTSANLLFRDGFEDPPI